MLAKEGRRVVADLPAVGENLRNDGTVLVPLDARNVVTPGSGSAVGLANPNDLYAGGAFLPYPNATTRVASTSSSDRFSQLIGAPGVLDDAYGFPTFSVCAIVLNVSSVGSAHIQSGDPLAEPMIELPTIGSDDDMRIWYWALKQQVLPIVDVLTSPAYGSDASTTQAADLLAALAAGAAGIPEALDWARDHYVPNHHWVQTAVLGTSSKEASWTATGKYSTSGTCAWPTRRSFPLSPTGTRRSRRTSSAPRSQRRSLLASEASKTRYGVFSFLCMITVVAVDVSFEGGREWGGGRF